MATRLELAYLLKKHFQEDPFDSELPVQIPIQGQIQLKEEAEMETAGAGANAMMGVRVQGAGDQQIFKFVRRSQIAGLVFPAISEENAKFSKLRFRILTSGDNQGQQLDFAVTYEIDNNDCRVVGGNAPLGDRWIALAILENNQFEFLYNKESGGPGGGGDPCEVWHCANTDNLAVKIKCILNGCPT